MPTTAAGLLQLIWHHPANRGRRLRAVTASVAWQAYKRTIGTPRVLTVYDGVRFRAYADSTEPGRFLYFGGWPDWNEMQFMRRYLRPGDRFVDGGAHEGIYTLLAASLVGRDGRVDAFEPSPKALSRLCENVALNDYRHVVVHGFALGETPAVLPFVIDRRAGSGNRIRTGDDAGSATIEVAVTTIDEAVPRGRVAMVKLDVEGAEPLVLQGAAGSIRSDPPSVWQLELVDRFTRRYGWSAASVVEWASDHGYLPALFDARSSRLNFNDVDLDTTRDILLVHRDERAEVLARIGAAPIR